MGSRAILVLVILAMTAVISIEKSEGCPCMYDEYNDMSPSAMFGRRADSPAFKWCTARWICWG